MQNELRQRYLDVMEKSLSGVLIEDPPIMSEGFKAFYRNMVLQISGDANPSEQDMAKYQPNWREIGWDQPTYAFTMVGVKRLRNFRTLVERVLAEEIAGDIIETGVWRGGASILAKAVLVANGVTDRRVILADSFEGLPPPDEAFPEDASSKLHEEAHLAVSLEQVRNNFEKFDLLDDKVVFLKGWFKDTLPNAPVDRLAIMRLDGDMYESTLTPLQNLYDKLTPGGFVIVDDYWLPPCKSAIHDFLKSRGIETPMIPIDGMSVYFQKT